MNKTSKIMVTLLATSFLGATALPSVAQQSGTSQTPKMEKRMAHQGGGKRGGGKRHGMRQAFERYDTNKDGVITQDEVDAAALERFNSIAGADGTITREEYAAAWAERTQRPRVRAFQRMDRDGDGNVTQAEFDSASERMFMRLDRDGNGELTRPAPRTDESAGNTQGQNKRQMRGGGHRGGNRVVALMERFDLDKDGKITRAEFDEVRGRSFAGTDADGSGSITLEEFSTMWQDLNGERMVRGFQRLDADGNLSVTQEEYTARSQNFVERNDRNGDGVVTRADRGKHKGKRGHHRSQKKPGQAAEPRKAGGPSTPAESKQAIDI